MLLTLKPPSQSGYSPQVYPHAYSPSRPPSSHDFSPTTLRSSLPPLPTNSPRRMSTPHRGLPLPPAMALSNPDRGPPIGQPSTQLQALPTPPQWQGGDEPMRNWLLAKAEEDRRKQEEEKTRQETLRLEQRKIEQTMLRESLQGGVPPYMVPMVFAGMGGGNLANVSLEWAQHYMAQISIQQHQAQLQQQQQAQVQAQQQQQAQQPQQQALQPQLQLLAPQQSSPDARRDARVMPGPQPNPYATQQPPALTQPLTQVGQQISNQNAPTTGYPPSYQAPNTPNERTRVQQPVIQAAPPTSAPRLPTAQSTLSRLNTGDMQIQAPPQGGLHLSGQHTLQQAQTVQQPEQQATSPSIYFHHWVPPASQKEPHTPSGRSQHGSPYSQNAAPHLRSEYANSPKKRKTNASHNPASGLPSKTPETSPSFSQMPSSGRRRAHSNQRSDASSRGALEALGPPGSRPQSRQRQHSTSEAESGSQRHTSTQPETNQSRDSAGPEKRSTGGGTPKQEPNGPS